MHHCVCFKSINITEKHFESSADLEKPTAIQKPSFLYSLPPSLFLSLFSHFLFAQLFIKINFPTGYSSACSLSFSFSYSFLSFLSVFLSFITLSARHTSDRARLFSIYCHPIFFHDVRCTLFSRCSQ